MKKIFYLASLAIALIPTFSCNDNSKKETGTHMHDDGATHSDHDTAKPVQQEFNVADTIKKDSSVHMHDNGEQHSH